MFRSIAIDGPAGAGKSKAADEIAKRLGFLHVDTGSLYRALALRFLNSYEEKFVRSNIDNVHVDLKFEDFEQKVYLNGIDVTSDLRSTKISEVASKVSTYECVRKFLLLIQREFAKSNNVVMDGRDISTVVLPNADIKFFLTASLEERAKRRFFQLREKNIECDYCDVLRHLKERDRIDSERVLSPLRRSNDSIFVDTTEKSLNDVIDFVIDEIRKVF